MKSLPVGLGLFLSGLAVGAQAGVAALPAPRALPLAPMAQSAVIAPPTTMPSEAAPLAAAMLAQARLLPSAAPLAVFAERAGLDLSVTPFAGKTRMGLDADNLAQYESGDRRVYVNWDYVGGDLRAVTAAGFSSERSLAVAGLLSAPVLAHEWRHAELRDAYGSDFPGLAEEEILTHLDQAAVLEEALARREMAGLSPLFERLYLYPHSKRLMDLRRQGFGPLAQFVLRRYRGISPALAEPARAAADARSLLARLEASPDEVPRGWREKARANLDFWKNPEAVKRLTAFLQERIHAAHKALSR